MNQWLDILPLTDPSTKLFSLTETKIYPKTRNSIVMSFLEFLTTKAIHVLRIKYSLNFTNKVGKAEVIVGINLQQKLSIKRPNRSSLSSRKSTRLEV